jgi:hypothetical protein
METMHISMVVLDIRATFSKASSCYITQKLYGSRGIERLGLEWNIKEIVR